MVVSFFGQENREEYQETSNLLQVTENLITLRYIEYTSLPMGVKFITLVVIDTYCVGTLIFNYAIRSRP